MGGDSKKIFGQDVPANLEPIVIVLDNSDDGKVRFRNDDIKDEVLDKLGDHVSNITKDAGNDPKLRNGSEEITTRTPAGNPSPLGDTNGTDTTYADSFESPESERAIAHFEQSSNSKLLPITIRKGKTDDKSRPTGLELFEEVNSAGKNSSIAQAIHSVQLDNNRYACEDEYVDPDTREDEDDSNVGHAYLQESLGRHTPGTFPALKGDGKEISFKVRRMKNLGIQTLLEASGEYFVPDDTDDFASVVASKAASSAPGLARLGVRVPTSRFSAANIAQEVIPDFRKDSNFPELGGEQRYSHGNVNNPLVPFSAVSSTSAGIAAVLLAITISTLVKQLASLLGPDPLIDVQIPDPMGAAFGADGRSSEDNADARKKRLGSYIGKDKDPQRETSSLPVPGPVGLFTGKFFILQPTQAPYDAAVTRGSEIFFGQVTNGALGLVGAAFGVGDSFKNVSENPAYYNVLLRMLVKSVTESLGDVVNTVAGVGAALMGETNPVAGSVLGRSALDIDKSIGLEADPTNLLNVVNSIRESKMIKFMDILAVIGDISIMTDNAEDSSTTNLFESSIDGVLDKIDDSILPNPAALIKKNRLSSNVNSRLSDHLAWGSNTLRSQYLLPSSIGNAELLFKQTSNIQAGLKQFPGFVKSENNRISQDDVRNIERELDAYYVPFYFHDLRTNEIISFHSFIESITDSHEAAYAETEGYGRIGKVHAYKNTNRSIACSFKVVATNPTDFSEMWHKVNKLVLMLYPQYTAGRQVTYRSADGTEQKFIQPFSQLISNSPMIRMRLGDLIKTNFSDLDLARMFGVGTDQFQITEADPNNANQLAEYNKKLDDAMEVITQKHLAADFEAGDKFVLSTQDSPGSRKPKTRVIKKKKGNQTPKTPSKTLYIVDSVLGPKKYIIKPAYPIPNAKEMQVNFNGRVPEGLIETHIPYVSKKAADTLGAPPDAVFDDVTLSKAKEFFDPELNPVVKSFESVKGQGLPGFIKRLSFDWADARWDTEGLNQRAPMWMKIDIEFSPVNEINPGIDSSGAAIGMPYNIGSILNMLKARRAQESDLNEDEAAYSRAKTLAATPTDAASDDDDATVQQAAGFIGGF